MGEFYNTNNYRSLPPLRPNFLYSAFSFYEHPTTLCNITRKTAFLNKKNRIILPKDLINMGSDFKNSIASYQLYLVKEDKILNNFT